ncbi:SurA N-terminal domain-containing protein [Porticoccaceae bacterium LTM1]|nr:SurA N-terminal domain-containing protein [Porticoccaceae bacterium LTM1]
MLQNMRDNLKGIGLILVVIIAIPFALTGVDNFFLRSGGSPEVAEVNGEKITDLELQRGILLQRQMIAAQFGEEMLRFFDDNRLRGQVLNQLVTQKLITGAANEHGMSVAESSVQQAIMDTPAFQRDGEFDKESFNYIMNQMGQTASSYRTQIRNDYLGGQFVQGVTASEFVTSEEMSLNAAVAEQTRDFYYLTIPVEPLIETVEVSEEQLQARYDEKKGQLVVPEQLVVEYLELDKDNLAKADEVSEEQIRERFDSELKIAKESGGKQKRLAHILLPQGDEELLNEVSSKLAEGAEFADVAKEYSTDAGTAPQGGDLGFIDMSVLPESLATAAASLSLGDLSQPVTSESGIHILKVTDVEQAELPVFEEQKDRIAESLRNELASERYAIAVKQLSDLVFGAETLQEPAETLGLEVKRSEPFSREGGEGIAANQDVVTAAFTDDVLNAGYASKVVELGDGRAVTVKLLERIAQRTKPLTEVREELLAELKKENAAALVEQKGQDLIKQVEAGESVEAVAKAESLEWQVSHNTKRSGGNVDATARQKAFAMPVTEDGRNVAGIKKANGDYLIVELASVEFAEIDSLPLEQRQALEQTLVTNAGESSIRDYQQWLLDTAEIKTRQ